MKEEIKVNIIDDAYKHYFNGKDIRYLNDIQDQYMMGKCNYEGLMEALFNSPIWTKIREGTRIVNGIDLSDIYEEYKHFTRINEIRKLMTLHTGYLEGKYDYGGFMKHVFSSQLWSRVKREPEILENPGDKWYRKYPSVVLTCYFTDKFDPQRKKFINSNDYDYIKPWYESMRSLDIHGIVFYDHLSDNLIRKCTTDRIKFVRCKPGKYSINDERFIIYFKFLAKNKYEKVFMSDVCDVTVNRQPFEIIKKDDDYKLFVGRDMYNLVGHSAYLKKLTKKYEETLAASVDREFLYSPMYNAGIVGGKFAAAFYFLSQMAGKFFLLDKNENLNMMVLNYIIYEKFHNIRRHNIPLTQHVAADRDSHSCSEYVLTGYPLCSEFFKFQENSDAFFIHK